MLVLQASSSIAVGYSNDAFECYVAVYSALGEKPTLVNPALRVGLHPQGNDPVIHIYGNDQHLAAEVGNDFRSLHSRTDSFGQKSKNSAGCY